MFLKLNNIHMDFTLFCTNLRLGGLAVKHLIHFVFSTWVGTRVAGDARVRFISLGGKDKLIKTIISQ